MFEFMTFYGYCVFPRHFMVSMCPRHITNLTTWPLLWHSLHSSRFSLWQWEQDSYSFKHNVDTFRLCRTTYLINWKNDFVDQQIPVVNGDCVSCNAEIWSESQMSEECWMWWLTWEKFHKRSIKRSDTSKYKKSISIKTPERRSLVGHSAGSIFLDTLESISWIIYHCSSEFHHFRFNSNVLKRLENRSWNYLFSLCPSPPQTGHFTALTGSGHSRTWKYSKFKFSNSLVPLFDCSDFIWQTSNIILRRVSVVNN